MTSVSYYPAPNNHVLYSILTNFSVLLPFDTTFCLRLPSLLINLFVVFFVYSFLKEYFNKNFSVVVTTLCLFLYMSIYYSYHARGYSLVFLCFILSSYSAFKITDSIKNTYYWACFAIANIAGFFTMPSFLYPYIMVNLFIFLYLKKITKAQLLTNISIISIVGLLYAPIIITNGAEALYGNTFVKPTGRIEEIRQLPWFLYLTFERIFGFANQIYEPNTALREAKHTVLNIFKEPFPFYSFFVTATDVLMFIIIAVSIFFIPFFNFINKQMKLYLMVLLILPPVLLLVHSVIPFSRTFSYYAVIFTITLLLPLYHFISKINNTGILFIQLVIIAFFTLDYFHLVGKYEKRNDEQEKIIQKVDHDKPHFRLMGRMAE